MDYSQLDTKLEALELEKGPFCTMENSQIILTCESGLSGNVAH